MLNLKLSLALMFSFLLAEKTIGQTGAQTALNFNGSGQYVVISDNTNLNPDTAITVEAWINPASFGANVYTNSIFCKHGWASGNQGYVLRCGDNGKVSFNIANSSGSWVEAASKTAYLQTGKWYHIAGTFDGDTVAVYVNGILAAYTLYSGKISVSSGLNPRIGDLANGGGRYFAGQIDEVRVWQRALNVETLRDWMCRKVSSSHPDYKTLGGYWKLDEGSGGSAKDETGNAQKNGLVNTPTWEISGAAIGDISNHTYNGSDFSLTSKFGDVFGIESISGSTAPKTVHIYANYQGSTQDNASGLTGKDDSTHYFGVYAMDPSTATFKINYSYAKYNAVKGSKECALDLYQKEVGNQGSWTDIPSKLYTSGDTLIVSGRTANEYAPVFYETDSNKIITTSNGRPWFCGSNPVTLSASGSDSFTYVWYKDGKQKSGATNQTLSVDSVGSYKVVLTRKGTSCSYGSAAIKITSQIAPTVTLSALTGVCEDVDSIALTGGSPAGGIYIGQGVFKEKFHSPSSVGSGTYSISYSYTDSNSCTSTASQNLDVYGLPQIKRGSTLEVCDNYNFVLLNHHTPAGGTYTGKYVVNNYFRLDSAGYKTAYFPFVYSITNANGCYNELMDSLLVKGSTPTTFPSVNDLCLQDAPITLTAFPSPGTYQGNGIVGNSKFDPAKAGKGTHLLRYSFTNQENCTTMDSQFVVVKPNGSVSWSYSLSTCQNEDSIQLTPGTPSGGTFSGNGVSTNGYFHPKQLAAGNHDIFYQHKDTSGCINKAKVVAVLLDTNAITISAISPVCLASDTFKLSNAQPIGGTFLGSGVVNNVFEAKAAGSGLHSIEYSYKNAKSCVSHQTFPINVLKNDSIDLSLPKTLCTYNDAVFIKTYPTGGKLTGKGIISTLFSPASSGAGNHLITYTITGSNGCIVNDTASVLVGDKPDVKLNNFASLCENDSSITLNGGTPVEGGSYFVNGIAKNTINPKSQGIGKHVIRYRVVNQSGCKDSVVTNLYVNKMPTKPTISLVKNTLTSSAFKGNQWYDVNGEISGETSADFSPTADGDYYVVVTNDSGCTNSSEPFKFAKIGIPSVNPFGFDIYPNPSFTGKFNVVGLATSNYNIFVYNNLGQQVLHQTQESKQGLIDLSSFENGIFIVRIEQDGKHFSSILYKTQ